jgi:hypothetical protein
MRRLLLVVGLIGMWWWWRDDAAVHQDAAVHNGFAMQAAVLRDGFAMRVRSRVFEIDRKGQQRKDYAVGYGGEVRIVGTNSGPAAVWIENEKVRLVKLATGKPLAVFGKHARMLCDGVATNDERFAVAWRESDATLWFVHGDTRVKRNDADGADVTDSIATATQIDGDSIATYPEHWCGIASAEDLIALLWRDRNRLFIQTCTRKKCAGIAASVAFDAGDTLLGFGCVRNACLLAVRNKGGERLQLVTESGATKWRKPFHTDMRVSIVGAGPDAFALGYSTGERETEIARVDRSGAIKSMWRGRDSDDAPSLAWSRDQLLVVLHGGDSTLIPFPK